MTASYLGTSGRHLLQEFLPNTVPLGATNPCPACPAGFIYLGSNGHSNKQTGQLQLRRRLRNGLTATIQYALSKATDDAGAFTGVRLDGAAIAQDWQHPEAEEAPSNFDQRHLVTAQFQYTTGIGVRGGGMLDGRRAKLLNGWTVTSQLTAGSGLPLTPIYLTSVAGTGVTGTIRPDVVPAAAGSVPDGFFVNPSAYTTPLFELRRGRAEALGAKADKATVATGALPSRLCVLFGLCGSCGGSSGAATGATDVS